MSTAMLVKPPVEMVTTTKSAPSRARRWSVVVDTVDLGAQLVVGDAGEGLHLLERGRVDVLEDEVHPGQRRQARRSVISLGDHW